MLFVLQNNPDGRRARSARKWFADNGPPDLQPLPLGYNEREAPEARRRRSHPRVVCSIA